MSQDIDPRLKSLSVLVHLEQAARHAESQRELAFLMVNDTRQLLEYRQAFFWRWNDFGRVEVELASHVSEVDRHAAAILALGQVAKWTHEAGEGRPMAFTAGDLPAGLAADWAQGMAPHALALPLRAPGTAGEVGGLVLAADRPWNEAHLALAEHLMDAYGHAWHALDHTRRRRQVVSHVRRYWRRYAAGLAVVLLLPLRQYVLVPAEVVARSPYVMAAPLSGVVRDVNVQPNHSVKAGEVLFTLDDTELANRLVVAQKAFEITEAEYLKNSQQAFSCDSCRARLPELAAAMEKQRAEVDWASAQLAQSRIVAPVDGVAVFSDANDWRGRPVSVGEKVMLLASPLDTRLQISMPVADAIAIEEGTEVVFYSNVSPLDSYGARILSASYEALPQPDQVLAYRIEAAFEDGDRPRLGMRGTAKVYGARAPLVYYLLRRPLAWLRQALGV